MLTRFTVRARTLSLAAVFLALVAASSWQANAQPAPSSRGSGPQPTAALPAGWVEVDQRMVFLTVQLSTVESSLAATNKSLKTHGYQQAARQADADKAAKANERMDRNGGGPVPWQDFYGQTAEKFFYHPTDANTLHLNPDAVAQRPPQFDYIYRANADRAQAAADDVQKIGDKIENLLAYQRQLETEQSGLWGKIAFRGDSSLNIGARPLYRSDLVPTASDDESRQHAQAAKAAVAFMSAIDRELTDVQTNLSTDPAHTFEQLHTATAAARADLNSKLLALPALGASLSDPRTPAGRFDRAVKRMDDSAQNIADAVHLAADCDTRQDQAGKNVYRGQLQQMIFDYASAFVTADQALTDVAAGWKLKQVGVLRPAPTTGPAGAEDVMAQLDTAKSETARVVTAARRAVAKMLDARLDAAADAGDLALVQSLAAARVSVVRTGALPEDIKDKYLLDAQKEAQEQIAAANDALAGKYRAAVASLTRARKFNDAQAVQDDLNAFLRDSKAGAIVSTSNGAPGPAATVASSGTEPVVAPRDTVQLPAKPTPFTRTAPSGWQFDNQIEVRPTGILLAGGRFVRSTQADFLNRDFTLDLWVTIDPKDPEACIGVGSGQNGIHQTPVNSIYMVVQPSGQIDMATREGYGNSGIGKEQDPGEYILRLEKRGLSVTYSIGVENKDGQFEPDVTQTFSDITKTPADFTDRNMHIFFGGGFYRQMRFAASAPHAQQAGSAATPLPDAVQTVTLSAVLPAYLESSSTYSATKDGVLVPGGGYIRTRKGDFLERDFVFDVWLAKYDKMETAQIGVGSGLSDLSNSVFLIVERRKVYTSIRRDKAKSIEDPGDYIARLEKKGTSVTFSLGAEKDGAFTADFTETIPDIAKTAGFTNRNMHIFFGSSRYKKLRFSASPAK